MKIVFLEIKQVQGRYWIIEVDEMIDIDKVLKDRDAIWKAAVIAHRTGKVAHVVRSSGATIIIK